MQSMLKNILSEIVDHPADVAVTVVAGEKTTIYELRCHKEDVGKVIGKNGKVISSIRALLTALSSRDNKRAVLEIVE